MWKRNFMVILIVASLLVTMSAVTVGAESQGAARTDGDLVIEDITLDGLTVDGNYVKELHKITVTFNNTGGTTITGKMFNCSIYNASGLEIENNNNAINDVAPATAVAMELTFWTPVEEGTYWINISVNLSAPFGNISMNKSFEIKNVYDLYPELVTPSEDILRVCADGTNKTIVAAAKVYNIGNLVVTNFNVVLEVWEAGSIVYTTLKSYPTSPINPGQNFTVTFDGWFNHTYGTFNFTVKTVLANEYNTSNDSDNRTINVVYTFWDEIEKGDITGTVIETDGTNNTVLEGVLVSIDDADFNQTALTDVNGTFLFTGLPLDNNTYDLLFDLDGYYQANVTGITVENATVNNTGNVTMEKIPLSAINGYVMNLTGTIAGASVYLDGILNVTSNETGYYEFVNVTHGAHTVTAYFTSHEEYSMGVVLVPGKTLEHNITMKEIIAVRVTTSPEDGAVNVPVDESVLIAFNVPFDPLTVNAATVIFYELGTDGNNTVIPADLIVTGADMDLEVNPKEDLKYGFQYQVLLTNLIKDPFNVSMLETNMTVTFTTSLPAAITLSLVADQANVSVATREFWAIFNTDIDITASVLNGSFNIRERDGEPIAGELVYDAALMKLTLTTEEDLASDTKYTLSIGYGLVSLDGISAEVVSFDFTTEVVETMGSITGVVLLPNGTPASGANVELDLDGVTPFITGPDGRYEFLDLPEGNYTITITFADHETKTLTATVTAGDSTDLGSTTLVEAEEETSWLEDNMLFVVIGIIVLILIIIVVIVIIIMMMRKPAEEEEEDDGGRRRHAPERRERAAAGAGGGGGGREERDYYDDEEGSECPNCGAVVSDDEPDCPECGVEFEEDLYECPMCNSHIDPEAVECPDCGASFAEEEPEEGDEDEYEEDEGEDYEVEVEDEDGVTRFNPKEEEEDEEEYEEEEEEGWS